MEIAPVRKPLIGVNCEYRLQEPWPEEKPRYRDYYVMPTKYFEALLAVGGVPALIPCVGEEDALADYLERVDGMLFVGIRKDYPPTLYNQSAHAKTRPDLPLRGENDMTLMRLAAASGKPVFGICGGIQIINIGYGGGLIQNIESELRHTSISAHEQSYHDVDVAPGSLLASALGPGRQRVNSSHHQCVDPERVGAGLTISAWAPDGVPEALEPAKPNGRFLLGVQWHPERIDDEPHRRKLFSAFVAACGSAAGNERNAR